VSPFWKIFVCIFCYVGAAVGLVLAVLNASQQPAATSAAVVFGAAGVVLLLGGIAMTRTTRHRVP
jgi:hypothetical protein